MYYLTLKEIQEDFEFLKNIELEFDEGWAKIVHKMCNQIQALLNNYNESFTINIVQMKEKYGTLRIYYVLNPDISKDLRNIINSIVQKAENDSHCICEKCGEVGSIRHSSSWIHTYCDECEESYLKEYEDYIE